MPRTSDRHQALKQIESNIEFATCALLVSLSEEEEMVAKDIKDFLIMQDIIASHRYLSSHAGISAGRHGDDSLDAYIHHYPDTAFHCFECIVHHSGRLLNC